MDYKPPQVAINYTDRSPARAASYNTDRSPTRTVPYNTERSPTRAPSYSMDRQSSPNRHIEYERKPHVHSHMALSGIESELSKLMGSLKRGPSKRKHVAKWNDAESMKSVDRATGIKSYGYLAASPMRGSSVGISASPVRTTSAGGKRAWELSQVCGFCFKRNRQGVVRNLRIIIVG
jgi:hypothetical protein